MHAEQSRSGTAVTLVRLHPGEHLHSSLTDLMTRSGWPSAVLASAIGSLSELRYSYAETDQAGRPTYSPARTERGLIEIASLQGHLGRTDDDEPQIHLHGVFAAADGRVVAGHVHSATVLVTIEIGLLCPSDVGWRRTISTDPRHPGLPVLDPVPAYSLTGRELDLVLLPPAAPGVNTPSVAASKAAK
ncbi:PPC domain-containing DNA-binding protein [Pseudonocardia spinosispora]|uniref:PPC domain-containing DNA-binding protein n=1 Tax=Pseudonocardia spinosispora TaxID=103441 RepID=UPI00048A7AAD|nr:PPC domain-containing DNA-binding protein [Pseudonocardia spinosispora]